MVSDKDSECHKSDLSTWEYWRGTPSHLLKDWVCSYSGYLEDVGRPVRRLEVPKDCVIMVVGFGDRLHISAVDSSLKSDRYDAFVVGLGTKPLIAEHGGAQRCIEIALRPWAIHRLFDGAFSELAQGVVNLEALWGNTTHLLLEQLNEQSSWQERFRLVDQILLENYAASKQTIRPEIQWAWNQLEQYDGCVPIRQLAKTVGWSDRYFATCFRHHMGITPKVAARLIRFNRAHRRISASGNEALSEIAASCGYSDQSHFSREFRQFSGCSPRVYQNAHFSNFLGTPGDIVD